MIPYENEKSKIEHEKYLAKLKPRAMRGISKAYATPNASEIVNPRRAYLFNDFKQASVYKCLSARAKQGVSWAICEKILIDYFRNLDKSLEYLKFDNPTSARRASMKCAELESKFQEITGDKAHGYISMARIDCWGTLY